ncbi:MAG: HAD family hydrolase [Erysipelotrichaceae bacterium]
MKIIRNIVFDLGNVLLKYDPKGFLESLGYDPIKVQDLTQLIFRSQEWRAADQGLLGKEEHTKIYLQKAPHYAKEIEYIMDHWVEMPTLLEDSSKIFLDIVDQGYQVYLLSNYPEQGFMEMWENTPLLHLAHGSVISYQLKLVKPMPEIYQHLLDKYGLNPEETLFLDDLAENIEGAKALGIHGIVFKNTNQVIQELRDYGIHIKKEGN